MGNASSADTETEQDVESSHSPSQIAVTLLEMNGRQYDLEVGGDISVAELKVAARLVLQVPVEFQVFAIGTEIAQDDEPLSNYVEDAERPLEVTFCFSDGGILSHESTAARCAAIESLTQVAHGGRKQVIDVFLGLSADDNELCRQAAVAALADVANIDCPAVTDDRFLDCLAARLLDTNKLIAVTAVQALGKAVEAGNEKACVTLLEFVEYIEDQEDMMLQLAVIEACLKLPKIHDRRVMRSLLATFNATGNSRVRSAAKNTAAQVLRRKRARGSCHF